jgi:chemotaxis signal transduction protein
VVDPAATLGIDRVPPERATHLVITLQDDWYGLVIDEMLDVVEIPVDAIEQATASIGEAGSDALTGVFAAPERLVHLLDPQRMIHSLMRPKPQAPERQGVSNGRS